MWSKAEWDLYWKRKEADWKAEKWRKRYGTLFVIVCFTILILPIAVILVPPPRTTGRKPSGSRRTTRK